MAKFKILAADKLAEEGLEYIRHQSDADLDSRPGLSEEELAQIVGQYDGMIVRSGVKVTTKVLADPGRLKAVVRAGVGVDNIDLEAATTAGILVMNSAEASTITTAEHAFALLMALARNIGPAYKRVAEGGWDRSKFQGSQLAGKTLGVVGLGRIGRTVAERALAFDMGVVAYDPYFNAPTALDGRARMVAKFEDMLPQIDILSFHVPLNDRTRGMLNRETFAMCRKGVLVVNAARGGVVDEDALLAAVESGQCGGAALDVFVKEPPPEDSPLRTHPKILVTPHLGASTVEAQQAVSVDSAVALLSYLRGEGIKGAVNVRGVQLQLDPLQAHYVDLGHRMAQILAPMLEEGVSEVRFELAGEALASARTTIDRIALAGLMRNFFDVSLNLVNVEYLAQQRGIKVNSVLRQEKDPRNQELIIEVTSGKRTHRICGRVYDDMRPRIVEINGYRMDMVPAGVMVLIKNEDRPGMIGLVGNEFGQAGVNIEDIAVSAREKTALMVLRVSGTPTKELIDQLTSRPGILKASVVTLPPDVQSMS